MVKTKLTKEQIAELKAVGIKADTQEDALPLMIAFLAKNDVDNIDDEPFTDMLEMCNAFADTDLSGDGIEDAAIADEETPSSDPETNEDELNALGKETGEGIDYSKQTIGALRKMAVEREILTQKQADKEKDKAKIIEMLEEADEEDKANAGEDDAAAGWDGLSDEELADLCVERELATPKTVAKMDRDEMIAQLTEDGFTPEDEAAVEDAVEEKTFDDLTDEELVAEAIARELVTAKMAAKMSREDLIEELTTDGFLVTGDKEPTKVAPKTAPAKPAAKSAPAAAPKQAAKPAAKAPAKPVVRNGSVRFDARNVAEHEEMLGVFIDNWFPETEYEISILKQGFTVRKLGNGNKIPVFNYDELKVDEKGELIGNLYMNRFESEEDLLNNIAEEHHDYEIGMFRGESHPCIRKIGQEAVVSILNSPALKEMLKRAGANDAAINKGAANLKGKSK